MNLVLTSRDEALVHAAWSLGYATHDVLRALVSPQTQPNTLRPRLRRLHQAGYLTQVRIVGATGHRYLYGAGRRARAPGTPPPWRPGIAQLAHTLDVGDALVALLRPDGEPHCGFRVVEWQGEAEVRAWAAPGAPLPDLRVRWQDESCGGWWNVEVDRATESRPAWRRKLARYLAHAEPDPILAVTTTPDRARGLARAAADIGAALWATTMSAVASEADPWVLDAVRRRRTTLRAAALDFTATAHITLGERS